MSDINIKQLVRLRLRMQILENLTLAATVGVGVAVYLREEMWTYGLVGALFFLFIYKYYTRVRLRKREFLSNIVEQRTMELRFQRDQIQAESHKLEQALAALAEAQDELVRKERLASVGQLTQGLVDRILNPLNYINNFAGLSLSLVEELDTNRKADLETGALAHPEETEEALAFLKGNLDKIAKHGASTVRIVKAMEELLKDRSGNRCTVEISELCKVQLELLRKNNRDLLERYGVCTSFSGLSVPLTIQVSVDQFGKALTNILNNSLYAVVKKADGLLRAEGCNPDGLSVSASPGFSPPGSLSHAAPLPSAPVPSVPPLFASPLSEEAVRPTSHESSASQRATSPSDHTPPLSAGTTASSDSSASRYQPEIAVTLRIVADKLHICIRDNGTGIEEGIRKKVFSPFFTTKPTGEAAGTGLYLSREIVLNHKGTIEIESEKGSYTEVVLALPIYQ